MVNEYRTKNVGRANWPLVHNLIQIYYHKNDKKLYGCFIDFSKAFDSVPRHKLLEKLLLNRVTGNFFNMIKSIYSNDKSCIKNNNKISETFVTDPGVKQGYVLSSLLFNIFLCLAQISISQDTKIDCVIWADDLLFLSESDKSLNTILNKLKVYCDANLLSIDYNKSKCIMFDKIGRFNRKEFYISSQKLQNVNPYKDFGIVFTPYGEINDAIEDLKCRAIIVV